METQTRLEVDKEGRLIYVYTDSEGLSSYYEFRGFKMDGTGFSLKYLYKDKPDGGDKSL